MDEPTIGLHPYNTNQLLQTLHRLKSYNNTLILVEHDQNVIESADHIIELGPGAGEWGGDIVDRGSQSNYSWGISYWSILILEKIGTGFNRKTFLKWDGLLHHHSLLTTFKIFPYPSLEDALVSSQECRVLVNLQ